MLPATVQHFSCQDLLLWCMQAAADRAAAIAVHEEDFQHLLETRDPPLTPQSSWPALRRQVPLPKLVHPGEPPLYAVGCYLGVASM